MKGLKKKLTDQSGASILLALLFFLLCCMVGASVLMASVSNAGKLHSNRDAQQEYLHLSSALRLVCDALTSAEYMGQYTQETVDVKPVVVDGVVTKEGYSYTKYIQKGGDFDCDLKGVLPLLPELDGLFAETFPESGQGLYQGDDVYTPLTAPDIKDPSPHTLTLTVNAGEVEGLDDTVTIKVEMEAYSIRLTATLGVPKEDDYIYTMEALLIPSGTVPDIKDQKGKPSEIDPVTGNRKTAPMKWKLAWIAKEEVGSGA